MSWKLSLTAFSAIRNHLRQELDDILVDSTPLLTWRRNQMPHWLLYYVLSDWPSYSHLYESRNIATALFSLLRYSIYGACLIHVMWKVIAISTLETQWSSLWHDLAQRSTWLARLYDTSLPYVTIDPADDLHVHKEVRPPVKWKSEIMFVIG